MAAPSPAYCDLHDSSRPCPHCEAAEVAAATPKGAVCLLHLNFQPCPWCAEIEAKRADDETEATLLGGEVEAATIDTTPRRRGPR